MKTSNETNLIIGDLASVCRGARQKWTLALLCMVPVTPSIASDTSAACVLDISRMLYAVKNLSEMAPIEQLAPADGKRILEQSPADGYSLQRDEKVAQQAEKAQLADWGAQAVRQNKVLTLRAESNQQRCYVNHAADFQWLEPGGAWAIFLGRFTATPYLRVDSYSMHDSPDAELFHTRNGRTLRFAVGQDAAILAPDGRHLLVVQESGFAVALLADAAPVVEMACAMPKLPHGDSRTLSFVSKGWSDERRLTFTLQPKDKSQPTLALRVQYSDGTWHLAASNPQALAQAGGLRCSTRMELPASAKSCSTGCEQMALMTIAPALSYYAELRKMFEWANDKGGEGHSAEIAEAKRTVENLIVGRSTPRDRKLARARNEQGLLALRAKDMPQAIEHLRAAYAADNLDIEILNNLGYAELLAGDENASVHLVSALLLKPGRSNAWANLGHLFARHAAHQEAQACFALALRFSANPAKTLQFLQDTAAKDSDPGLSRAVQLLLTQPWLAQLTSPEQGQ